MSNTFDYILRHLIMSIIYHWEVGGMKMWMSTFGQQYGQQCWIMYNISKFTDFLPLKEFVKMSSQVDIRQETFEQFSEDRPYIFECDFSK